MHTAQRRRTHRRLHAATHTGWARTQLGHWGRAAAARQNHAYTSNAYQWRRNMYRGMWGRAIRRIITFNRWRRANGH